MGTVFEHTKLPLSVWFFAIYLMTQSKNAVSALELKRQLGVSYKAAWQAIDTLTNLAGAPLVERTVGGSGGGGASACAR